jgi:hypothetical protein
VVGIAYNDLTTDLAQVFGRHGFDRGLGGDGHEIGGLHYPSADGNTSGTSPGGTIFLQNLEFEHDLSDGYQVRVGMLDTDGHWVGMLDK